MAEDENLFIGCSVDGLRDRLCLRANGASAFVGSGYYLQDVVIPSEGARQFLTGHLAEESRVASGLPWPRESRLTYSEFERPLRLPIALAWQLMVLSKSRTARWALNRSSYAVAQFVAAQIRYRFEAAINAAHKQRKKGLVVAIPDELDEFGQEDLRRYLNLSSIGRHLTGPVELLWRPVAVALSFLDRLSDEEKASLTKDDFLLIIHLGPDAIELVPIGLRRVRGDIVPIRHAPKCDSLYGAHLAENFLCHDFGINDPVAFWQAFTDFPETWQLLSGDNFSDEGLPRPWFKDGAWDFWNPSESCDCLLKVPYKEPTILNSILGLPPRAGAREETWERTLLALLKDRLEEQKGSLIGAVFSGPIGSKAPQKFFRALESTLINKGLSRGWQSRACKYSIYCPDAGDDLVANGCSLYGEKLDKGVPTFLDELPGLHVKVRRSNDDESNWWPSLLDPAIVADGQDLGLSESDLTFVEGGKPLRFRTKPCFRLPKGRKVLDFYLARSDSPTVARHDRISFPLPTPEDTQVSLHVRVASANGFAQVEVVPEERDFLQGRSVSFDFRRMRELPVSEIADNITLSVPEVEKPIDVIDFVSYVDASALDEFLGREIHHVHYVYSITGVTKSLRGKVIFRSNGDPILARAVNQFGVPIDSSKEAIARLRAKINKDFLAWRGAVSRLSPIQRQRVLNKLNVASRWFYAGAPESVKDWILQELASSSALPIPFIDTCGQILSDQEEIELFFRKITFGLRKFTRAQLNAAIRAIGRIFRLRETAPYCITEEEALLFSEVAVQLMEEQANGEKFKKLFKEARECFLSLLRFRKVQARFLPPSHPLSKRVRTLCESSLSKDITPKVRDLLEKLYVYAQGEGDITILWGTETAQGTELEEPEAVA